MPIIDINKIEAIEISEPCRRSIKIVMTPETQEHIKDFSIVMGTIHPHKRNDLHTHEGYELLYIVSGSGKAVLGDDVIEIGPDTLIIAPPGTPHQQFNESEQPMKMFTIWNPAVAGEDVINRAIRANR